MCYAAAFRYSVAAWLLSSTALLSQSKDVSSEATKPKSGKWQIAYAENFEEGTPLIPAAPIWAIDAYQNTDKWADGGSFFRQQGIAPPVAYRIEAPFGTANWLTVAAYSRSNSTSFQDLFQIVPDPMNAQNHALRVTSPLHTDGTVIRSSVPLPQKYRVCLKVGFAAFGDGVAGGLNGYLGGETPGPWLPGDATVENGFYWMSILDSTPRPHNNVWIHHHRKVTIDSDNNTEGWTNMWESNNWVADGKHPVMMFATSKEGTDDAYTGKPFLSWSQGALQPAGDIRTADAYNDNTWYNACIERNATDYVLTTSGNFRFGGQQTYVATIPVASVTSTATSIPDFFMFGDPHNNYYRGTVYYDDITLETWKEGK